MAQGDKSSGRKGGWRLSLTPAPQHRRPAQSTRCCCQLPKNWAKTEKQVAVFAAINLTKLTFNPVEAKNIQNGTYQFVYLSPKILLNSKLWYKRKKKKSALIGRHKECGIFWPFNPKQISSLIHKIFSIYPPERQNPNHLIITTLIYSSESVRLATSNFARRFHSCTGKSDKIALFQAFLKIRSPLFLCTMALGRDKIGPVVVVQLGFKYQMK
ncbi:hypothetical protein VP01_1191g7 [Puccinia sorghi]|uniref:Uncharacterized protein n=1 Tax=Puccinia sorghi TaxID=27349 RepID=A0A0L6VS99_9BASI|nr:hypothetical protein VP01_1191g7 [Puccinia sorghi]